MSGRDILATCTIGLLLFLGAAGVVGVAIVALSGCTPYPEPVEPSPPDEPVSPPLPPPAETPCGRAAARALELRCTTDGALFEDACERYGQLIGASGWDPECMVEPRVDTCAELEACRGGT